MTNIVQFRPTYPMVHVFPGWFPDGTPIWIVDLVEIEGSCIMDVSTEKPSLRELRELRDEFGCTVIMDEN